MTASAPRAATNARSPAPVWPRRDVLPLEIASLRIALTWLSHVEELHSLTDCDRSLRDGQETSSDCLADGPLL